MSETGVNLVFATGYGLSSIRETLLVKNAEIQTAYDTFKHDNDTYLDAPYYGEVSIGYAF